MVILNTARLSFPFDCESPFLFAVYHLDKYPPGGENMGPDKKLLRGHNIGADFGNPAGWSMYHGTEGVPGFPKHPHRGFETITVTRQGLVDHTDSLGNGGRFGNGDVQWMTAGKGISHAEMFPLLDRAQTNVLELFQIWINLPKATKMSPPSFKMFWGETLPQQSNNGAEVALIAGSLPGFAAPPDPPPDSYAQPVNGSDVLVATVKLAAGASWTLPAFSAAAAAVDVETLGINALRELITSAGLSYEDCIEKSDLRVRAGEALKRGSSSSGGGRPLHRNLYFYAGDEVSVGGKKVGSHSKIKVQPDAEIVMKATGGPAEVLVLQGRDIGEPTVQHGPFVGNTQQDIMKAFSDYQATGFGSWPWESEALAFPRERPRFAKYADGRLEEKPSTECSSKE